MTTIDSPVPIDAASSFTSLAALRTAHSSLLRRHREASLDAALLDDIAEFVRRGQATGAILDAEADRAAAQSVLDYWDTTLYRAGRESVDPTLAAFDETYAPELDDALCPYVGLDAFREANHARFFGRQRLLDEWIGRLPSQRLLVVLGPSGSGKSSLVLGGLIPALKAGALPGSQQWRYLPVLVPGSDPLSNLARLTRPPDISPSDWLRSEAGRLRHEPTRLARLVSESGPTPVVIVVDQFEEMFTLCIDEQARRAFAGNLLGLLRTPGLGHLVILTMRSDFEQYLACLPELEADVERAQARVGPLNPSELRDVIEKPAEQVGLKFEEGVVDAVIQEMQSEPAGLPLLQFTLLKLWEQRKRNRVTREAYARLGGVRRALERSADQLYEELSPLDQDVVKRILLRMVRPDRGLEVTSSRIPRQSIYADNFSQAWVDPVLTKLIDARLVRETKGDTPADDQLEVAHEALVRNWGRLLEWLDEERDTIRGRLRLTAAAEHWDARGRPPDALLRGQVLKETLSLNRDGVAPLAVRFLECSQEVQARELLQHRRARQLSVVGLALTVMLIFALPTVFFSGQSRLAEERANVLQEKSDLALARQLVAQARAALKDGQRDLALLLSIEAVRAHDALEARGSLLTALAYTPDATVVREHSTTVRGVAFSPDGQTLASVDDEGRIVLWGSTTYLPLGPPLKSTSPDGKTVVAAGLAFSSDGSTLAMTTDDGLLVVWCVASRTQQPLPVESCPPNPTSDQPSMQVSSSLVSREGDSVSVWDLSDLSRRPLGVPLAVLTPGTSVFALSPNGKLLAGGSDDGRLSLWDATTGLPYPGSASGSPDGSAGPTAHSVRLPVEDSAVRSLAFSRDGSKLAWGTADGTMTVWSLARNKSLLTLHESKDAVTSLAFGPDDRLAWGTADAKLYARDLSTGTRLPFAAIISSDRASAAAVAFSPDGQEIPFVSAGDGVTVFPIKAGPQPRKLAGGDARVTSLVFGPNGQRVAAGTQDATIWLWDTGDAEPDRRLLGTLQSAVSSLAFSSDGSLVVAGGDDGQLVVWDVATGAAIMPSSPGHAGAVAHLTFSPDGHALASVSEDGARLWSLAGHELSSVPFYAPAVAASVQSVAFSPNGKLLASGLYDGTIVLWDTATGERRIQLRPASAAPEASAVAVSPFAPSRVAVTAVAFSPDGSLLAAGAFDGGLTLWDTTTGLALAPPLRIHEESISSLSFSPSGAALASVSADIPLVVWSLDVDTWIADACAAAHRNLTEGEWKQYLGDSPYHPTCPEPLGERPGKPSDAEPVSGTGQVSYARIAYQAARAAWSAPPDDATGARGG